MKCCCAKMLSLMVRSHCSFYIIVSILKIVHIQQIHLFENEASFSLSSQNLLWHDAATPFCHVNRNC